MMTFQTLPTVHLKEKKNQIKGMSIVTSSSILLVIKAKIMMTVGFTHLKTLHLPQRNGRTDNAHWLSAHAALQVASDTSSMI